MILGDNRVAVIENIKTFAQNGEFHKKVELNDPVLTAEESRAITQSFMENRTDIIYRVKSCFAVTLAKIATKLINKDTKIIGIEKIPNDIGGALITSNHFSPLENTVIRHLTNNLKRSKLGIISQTSNFAMKGPIGFLMNYTVLYFEGIENLYDNMLKETIERYEKRITNIILECFATLEDRADNIYDGLIDIDKTLNMSKILGLSDRYTNSDIV